MFSSWVQHLVMVQQSNLGWSCWVLSYRCSSSDRHGCLLGKWWWPE